MNRAIGCIVASLICAWPAEAAAPEQNCFAQVYGPAHLAANPAQHVRRIVVKLRPMAAGSNEAEMGVSVRLKGKQQAYGTGGNCTARADGWQCQTDTDGEAPVMLRWRGDVLMMTLASGMKVTHFPKNDYPDDQHVRGAADSVFILRPSARCSVD